MYYFSVSYSEPFRISGKPDAKGRIYSTNGKYMSWKVNDVKEILNELPPVEDFDEQTFTKIKRQFATRFSNVIIGRIIYNLYHCELAKQIGIEQC